MHLRATPYAAQGDMCSKLVKALAVIRTASQGREARRQISKARTATRKRSGRVREMCTVLRAAGCPYASCKEYGFRLCEADSMQTERRCEAAWLSPRRYGPARPAAGRGVPRACWAWSDRWQAQVKGPAVFFAPSRRSLNRSVLSAPT
ncbi:hypothetical protein E2C01_056695 [Portunus trituberculatus]|uniref:Uncharacterized protein n=1 Tax=Portunus trituberculatus TaxID=210409 RepID=A0A5B7H0A8_PORTR|nr:hypothetical protein [Portunus trituberculatus]